MRAAFVAVVAIVFGVSVAEASHLAEQPKKHRIVYHLDEASIDKTKFALGNLENHVKGVGGIANVEAMELVVHGPALRHFVTTGMDPGVKEALERLQAQGLVLGACGNTMRGSASRWTSCLAAPRRFRRAASSASWSCRSAGTSTSVPEERPAASCPTRRRAGSGTRSHRADA